MPLKKQKTNIKRTTIKTKHISKTIKIVIISSMLLAGVLTVGTIAFIDINNKVRSSLGIGIKGETDDKVISQMNDHMKEKYGDVAYSRVGFFRSGFEHGYDLMNAKVINSSFFNQKTKKYEDPKTAGAEFTISRYKTDSGYEIKDTYFGFLIKDDFEKMIKKLADNYFSENTVRASTGTNEYPNKFTYESTLQDVINSHDIDGTMIIIAVNNTSINEGAFKVAAKNLIDEWDAAGNKNQFRIVYVNNDLFIKATSDNWSDLFNQTTIVEVNEE
ncbi:MAG: hypothetical protein WCI79_01815 [Candidatus Saccharibacteria bacterium]